MSRDVLHYKYLIRTLHRDVDHEFDLFKTVDVVEETDQIKMSGIGMSRCVFTSSTTPMVYLTNISAE